MEPKIPSQALDVNLAATRREEIIIPKEHQWFLVQSEKYWGIHNRTMEFLQELHHKYSSSDVVLKQLDKIAVEDSWLYEKCADSDRAYKILLGMYVDVKKRNLSELQQEHWLRSFARFFARLSESDARDENLIRDAFNTLKTEFPSDHLLLMKNARLLLEGVKHLEKRKDLSDEAFDYLKQTLEQTAVFWKKTADLSEWEEKKGQLFSEKGAKILSEIQEYVLGLTQEMEKIRSWEDFNDAMFYKDIAEELRHRVHFFDSVLERIYFLGYLIYLPGLAHLRDHLLWDLNAQLKKVTEEKTLSHLQEFFDNIFVLWADMFESSADIVLDCELTLGKNLIPIGDQSLIDDFIERSVKLGFVGPSALRYTDDWILQVNPNHVKNIRVWLQLFELNPQKMKKLFSALIVYLRVGGIFISDTDLFQKDISQLLNADISGCFKQVKQLCRIFPIYFNEVGAEGDIRDFSTAIDQLRHRKDRLIHFYRKQVHTESNNLHIDLTRSIILYWFDGELHGMEQWVPESVLKTMDKEAETYTGVHSRMVRFFEEIGESPEDFLNHENRLIYKSLSKLEDEAEIDSKRIWYILRMYTLLREKYSLDATDIIQRLHRQTFLEKEEIDCLEKTLQSDCFVEAISCIYDVMEKLNKRVLDPEKTESVENIYYKRHIAAGIPSMYGEYREPKFESLGLIFRLERLVMRLFEKVLEQTNVQVVTIQSLQSAYDILKLFQRGLILDGMVSPSLQSTLEMLKYSLSTQSFSIGQYANIFQFMAKNVKELINEYFLRVYEHPLQLILPQLYGPQKDGKLDMVSEEFYREILVSGFLIQPFDEFVSSVGQALLEMGEHYDTEVLRSMMSIDVDMTMTSFAYPDAQLDNQIFIGAKAYYLKLLYQKEMPVPPGFILTTELFRHLDVIRGYSPLRENIDNRIFQKVRHLEELSGKRFGDPSDPLLLSVRSGTAFSMPGAMNTFLNIGLNDEITEAWSKDERFAWSAWDSYRRLLQTWGMAHGLPRDDFDDIMIEYKERYDVELKAQFESGQMREIALAYKQKLKDNGIEFVEDINQQLERAIVFVMESWDSERCLTYRRHLQIAEEWGTAVVIQQMVMGNIDSESGTGVVFTHNPKSSKAGISLYGDFVFRSQGEDIVGGLVHAQPVSAYQEGDGGEESLEVQMPGIYHRLEELAKQLIEEYGFTHQEIEFTFESADPDSLYILQIRDQLIEKRKSRPFFKEDPEKMKFLGRGIGIGGGAISGRIGFTFEDLQELHKKYPQDKTVLVRPDTVPDDIKMIFEADALITARGGATSHAAVTASRLGKVCIVNCRDLVVDDEEGVCHLGEVTLKCGDEISLDGSLGTIFQGVYPVEEQEIEEEI